MEICIACRIENHEMCRREPECDCSCEECSQCGGIGIIYSGLGINGSRDPQIDYKTETCLECDGSGKR